MITYYLPSGLFVVVSWISFLVNPECIPGDSPLEKKQVLLSADVILTSHMKGRMSLLITIFLVLINIYNTIQTNSPQVWGSYQILKEEGGSWEDTRGFPFNSNIFL